MIVNANLAVKNLIQIKSGIEINIDVDVKIQQKKVYVWNPSTCACEINRYLRVLLIIY